jgi:hypothetical protein
MTTDRFARRVIVSLVLLGMAGCSLDGPVTEDQSTVSLRLEAPLPAGGTDKDAPPPLMVMLRRPERLSAMVVIERLDAGGRVVARVGGGELADVSVDLASSRLRVEGVIDVEPGHLLGSRYRLSLELRYRGDDVTGEYRGEIALRSGIVVVADPLHIGELPDLDGQPTATSDFALCLSSPAIDGDPACVSGEDLDGAGLVFEPATDVVTFGYQRGGVNWEGSDQPRTIIVNFRGGLLATTIMAGTSEIGPFIPGRLEPVEVEIPLVSTVDDTTGPGRPGEVLAGDVQLRFADGLPPAETGRAVLVRTVAAERR